MTMYQELLGYALDGLDRRHRSLEGSDLESAALNDATTYRQSLSELSRATDASGTIAANVNYDAALILLARTRGIESDLAAFARPEIARAELEASLWANREDSSTHARRLPIGACPGEAAPHRHPGPS
jgi:hypothetical protein